MPVYASPTEAVRWPVHPAHPEAYIPFRQESFLSWDLCPGGYLLLRKPFFGTLQKEKNRADWHYTKPSHLCPMHHTHTHMAAAAVDPHSSSFVPARVLRRTGRQSYAVQLPTVSPGVVEIHCHEDHHDWGWMTSTWTEADRLEDRLVALGTRSMFAWDDSKQRMAPKVNPAIEAHEGVEVQLGRYDVKKRGFVQCRLRAVVVNKAKEETEYEECEGEQGNQEQLPASAAGATPSSAPTSEKTRKRRPFQWLLGKIGNQRKKL